MSTRFKSAGYDVGTVTSFSGITRSVSSRILKITVNGTGGADGKHVSMSGLSFSNDLGLRDNRVYINRNLNVTGAIRKRYDALGCAPGPAISPQRHPANGAAQKFAVGGMYHNSNTGRTTWLRGAIYRKYDSLRGPWGLLGLPTRPVVSLHDLHGKRGLFEGGSIYFKQATGAHELHGAVLRYYLSRGGASSTLRFPTSDVRKTASGGTTASFQGGRIVCSSSGRCRVA
jgi:uncharacterized protein with LGFP repeats